MSSSGIVVVGSLNADLVVRLPRFPRPGETLAGDTFAQYPGGKGGNQAYAAARLADGTRVAMLGRVGRDAHGAWLRGNLAGAGVDVAAVIEDPAVATGVAVISIDATGQNEIVIVPGANGTLRPTAVRQYPFTRRDIVLLQLEIPLETVLEGAKAARASGATVILDPAPAQALPGELLDAIDWLTPNEPELAALLRDPADGPLDPDDVVKAARRLRAGRRHGVIVKLGARGALVVTDDGESFVPAFPVPAVDTTAAGDCFNAAFAIALADAQPPAAAARFAAAAAAISVTRHGAQPSMPSRAEVLALLAG